MTLALRIIVHQHDLPGLLGKAQAWLRYLIACWRFRRAVGCTHPFLLRSAAVELTGQRVRVTQAPICHACLKTYLLAETQPCPNCGTLEWVWGRYRGPTDAYYALVPGLVTRRHYTHQAFACGPAECVFQADAFGQASIIQPFPPEFLERMKDYRPGLTDDEEPGGFPISVRRSLVFV